MKEALKAVSAARRDLILDHPFFGVLSLKLELVEDASMKTLRTDGKKLRYNPEYVLSLSRYEMVGVMAHEVMHCANGHTWRRENRDPNLWNYACDYAINPIVLDAGMVLPAGALDGFPYKGMGAEEIYAHLVNQQPREQPDDDDTDSQTSGQGDVSDGDSQGDPCGDPDDDSTSNSNPGQDGAGESQPDGSACGEVVDAAEDASPELQADWSAAVLNAAKRAESIGGLPVGMERLVEEIKNPPQDWRAILRRFVQQNAMSDYSWRQPNPRFMYAGLYLPVLRDESMPPMLVAVDTSGSIDEITLNQFAREIDSIIGDMQPERVYVVYCDAEIHGVDIFERGDPVTLNPKGFGGTDFRPVFEWVEAEGLQPSCLVYLTDLCGDFPSNPPGYPVLWGDTSEYGPPPWGESVRVRCY